MKCHTTKHPIFIIEKKDMKAYFWAEKPCFTCKEFDKCEEIESLKEEFIGLEVYGYRKSDRSKSKA